MNSNNTNHNVLSNTISILRFPLILSVVFIHTNLLDVVTKGEPVVNQNDFQFFYIFQHVLNKELFSIAVPIFFFISGFLFFYKMKGDFDHSVYLSKIKKRIKTLLIPYIFWNIIVFLLLLLSQIFIPSMMSGKNKLISEYNITDYINIFWSHNGWTPICYQFWFIRDLMVVVLFSPFIYILAKYLKAYSVFIWITLWFFDLWTDVPGFSIVSFSFFSIGAWFSLNKSDFTILLRKLIVPSLFLYVLFIAISTLSWYRDNDLYPYLNNLTIVTGIIAIIGSVAYMNSKQKIHPRKNLLDISFFIYAFHGMPIVFAVKYWVIHMPTSEISLLSGYILCPVLVVIIGFIVYYFLNKYFNSFTKIITGDR